MTSSEFPEEAMSFISEWLGPGWQPSRLAGDASVRQYYRILKEDKSYMIAYYPESVREGVQRFIDAYRAIEAEARVPTLLCHSDSAVAQADVGDQTLLDLLRTKGEQGRRLYSEAIDLLVSFQRAGELAGALNPPFTAASFRSELEMSRQFYLKTLVESPDAESPALQKLFDDLCTTIVKHPYRLCHRDYHGENIHVVNNVLFMIDYQDMRMGPDTYDLASLLRDRGVAALLGRSEEEALIERYRKSIGADPNLRDRYFQTLLQRSIKILGTFAKQAIVRGKSHYLAFIPPTLESIALCGSQLEELRPLAEFFPTHSDHAVTLTGESST